MVLCNYVAKTAFIVPAKQPSLVGDLGICHLTPQIHILHSKEYQSSFLDVQHHSRTQDANETDHGGELCASDKECRGCARGRRSSSLGRSRGRGSDGDSLVRHGHGHRHRHRITDNNGRHLSVVLAHSVGGLGIGTEGDVGALRNCQLHITHVSQKSCVSRDTTYTVQRGTIVVVRDHLDRALRTVGHVGGHFQRRKTEYARASDIHDTRSEGHVKVGDVGVDVGIQLQANIDVEVRPGVVKADLQSAAGEGPIGTIAEVVRDTAACVS